MAAEVSSLFRMLNGYKEEKQQEQVKIEGNNGKSNVLITRDLLGTCSKFGSKELDLDSQVPNGWEKQLDMKSGKIYLKRSSSPISSTTTTTSSDHQTHHQQQQQQQKQQNRTVTELQDLNFPPSSTTTATTSNNLFEESLLDLKLIPAYDYKSVCTLDKVKSALERAEKESIKKKRSRSIDGSSSFSSSSSSMIFAAGCPSCLMYVLISKRNPKCPRCDSIVPSPVVKKPRIDLNISV